MRLAFAASISILLASSSIAQEWTSLWSGDPAQMNYWRPTGKATIDIANDEIVVRADKKMFLVTNRVFADFELELEIKADLGANSGIQLRSHIMDGGRVFGYQAEVDTSPRAWSGGIYDEGRRGWIAPPKTDEARRAFRNGEWNKYRVLCEGNRIRVWVNDVLVTDLRDEAAAEGIIGLQHHGESGKAVRWRNVRVRDLGRPLFDGESLAGWRQVVRKTSSVDRDRIWSVRDGTIACRGWGPGYIVTEESFENYELELEWRWSKRDAAADKKRRNSGVILHVDKTDVVWPTGVEAQLMEGRAGDFYLFGDATVDVDVDVDVDDGRRDPSRERLVPRLDGVTENPIGEWNTYRIRCEGDQIRLWINDVLANEARSARPSGGRIALQSEGAEIRFRNVRLRRIGSHDKKAGVMNGLGRRHWGMADGKPVDLYRLKNENGVVARISTYGATVTELHCPDRDGQLADVVLGFEELDDYDKKSPYFGCIVGRVANRIAGGRFRLGHRDYELATNNGPNHLHGGKKGLDKVVWAATPSQSADGLSLELTYRSRDGEEGYPGNVDFRVVYTLTDTNELRIEMTATTDRPTPINLAHHSYWNLAGHDSGNVFDHELTIAASHYTPADKTLIPLGTIASVAGTPFDFTERKRIGHDIATLQAKPEDGHGGGYDLNFALDGRPDELMRAAVVRDPKSGRRMEIWTDQPGIQFYTGNFLDGIAGKAGATYAQYQGFCLETQKFPDAVNQRSFPSVIVHPGTPYRHVMIHRFSVDGN